MRSLSKTETMLTTVFAALVGLAVFGPSFSQPEHYHLFADQRGLGKVPNFLNVLSNLPFAAAGMLGMYGLWALPRRVLSNVQRAMAVLFFTGLLLTAAGSSWYHWDPDNAGLALDRGGMAVAFAGLLGLGAAGRVSERAGAVLGLAPLLLAWPAIEVWSSSGNVLPWAVFQFGGAALLLWLALLRPRYWALDVRWLLVILLYAAAKALEMNDHEIYHLTGHLVSGHTFKHLLGALAAWPVIGAICALRHSGQNAAGGGWMRGRFTHHAEEA